MKPMDWVDEKLATALYDVPVPKGLAERLLERLENEGRSTRNDEVSVLRSSFFVLRLSLLATAAGLLVAVWLGMRQGERNLSEPFVLDEAIRAFDRGIDPAEPLQAEKPAPAEYPLSLAVLPVRGTRWRLLDGSLFLGRRGVVYDLPGPAGASAALYVVDAEPAEGFATAPTGRPFTTAGCCAASWREGDLLYVLVVQGDTTTYRAYLNLPHDPVAQAIDKVPLNPSNATDRKV
jgi:hypothetical protein